MAHRIAYFPRPPQAYRRASNGDARMMRRTRWTATLGAAVVLLSGCGGDPTEPSEVFNDRILSAEEQAALQTALSGSGALAGLGTYTDLVVRQMGVVGSMDVEQAQVAEPTSTAVLGSTDTTSFGVVGMQVKLFLRVNRVPFNIIYTGLVAWTDLDVATRSVHEVISILAFGNVTTGAEVNLGSVDEQFQSGGLGVVVQQQDTTIYAVRNGSFTLTELSFGTTSGCSGSIGSVSGCTLSTGRMSGSFDFNASAADGDSTRARSASFEGIPSVSVSVFVQ